MIDIKITNTESISRVIEKLEGVPTTLNINIAARAFLLKSLIDQALIEVLKDDAKHFRATVMTYGVSFDVTVAPIDETGKKIYSGEKEKKIVSDKPMPIGQGLFSKEVTVPEKKGRKEDINKAIREAVIKFRVSLRTIDLIK